MSKTPLKTNLTHWVQFELSRARLNGMDLESIRVHLGPFIFSKPPLELLLFKVLNSNPTSFNLFPSAYITENCHQKLREVFYFSHSSPSRFNFPIYRAINPTKTNTRKWPPLFRHACTTLYH